MARLYGHWQVAHVPRVDAAQMCPALLQTFGSEVQPHWLGTPSPRHERNAEHRAAHPMILLA
jgi:hypothetical protein